MSSEIDPVKLMKQQVGFTSADRLQSGAIVGLGTGSTIAYAIQCLGDRLKSGDLKDIKGIPTSFQASVLAKQYGIPLTTLIDPLRLPLTSGTIHCSSHVTNPKR